MGRDWKIEVSMFSRGPMRFYIQTVISYLPFAIGASALAWTCPARGDCSFGWKPLGDTPGVNGSVYAMTVYDDGTGPALYVGGQFSMAGNVAVKNIAKWNGTEWSALSSGLAYGDFGCTLCPASAAPTFVGL